MAESKDFSRARYMESFESGHSDHSFTARLGGAAGITAPPLRLDSQAKYGSPSPPLPPPPPPYLTGRTTNAPDIASKQQVQPHTAKAMVHELSQERVPCLSGVLRSCSGHQRRDPPYSSR